MKSHENFPGKEIVRLLSVPTQQRYVGHTVSGETSTRRHTLPFPVRVLRSGDLHESSNEFYMAGWPISLVKSHLHFLQTGEHWHSSSLKDYTSTLTCGGKLVSYREDAIFLTHDGCPLTRQGLSCLFKQLRVRSGIEDKRVYHHQCRRYMATTQLAMGRSALDVQRQMGHTTLTVTNHYASLTVEHLRQSQEKYSPLRVKDSEHWDESGNGDWDE